MPELCTSTRSYITGNPFSITPALYKVRIYYKIDDLSEQLKHIEKQTDKNNTTQFLQKKIDHCEDKLVIPVPIWTRITG